MSSPSRFTFVELFYTVDPKAAEKLFKHFCKAARRTLYYRDKAGKMRSLPPAATEEDAEEIAANMRAALWNHRVRSNGEVPCEKSVNRMWRNIRVNGFKKELRQREEMSGFSEDPDSSEPETQLEQLNQMVYKVLLAKHRSEEEWRTLRLMFEAALAKTTGARQKGLYVLWAHRVYGSYTEIAQDMGESESTVRSWARRAYQDFLQMVLNSEE